jgi:hypothetical protein
MNLTDMSLMEKEKKRFNPMLMCSFRELPSVIATITGIIVSLIAVAGMFQAIIGCPRM